MKQTKKESAMESTLNVLSGMVISYLVWILIIPIWWPHLKTDFIGDIGITLIYTVVSWLRSYCWRRFFANGIHNKVLQFTGKNK